MREGVNKSLYRDDVWQWQEGDLTVSRSCQWSGPGCHQGCSVLFYTKDGKLVKIEGDPNSPVNDGRLCMRCLAMVEAVNHPDRVRTPLRRVGERGENKWEEISWDEAYDIIVEKAKEITEKYGTHSIATGAGTGRNACWQTPALAFAGFRTGNDNASMLSGDSCYSPRMMATNAILGETMICDCGQFNEARFDEPEYRRPDMILIWGNNPVVSNPDGFFGHWIIDCMRRGTEIMVVDPRLTWLAAKAKMWLPLRPGTDGALALGMMNVMINEKLYNEEFVDRWCYGFEALAERVQEYPPEKVAEITGIPAEKIIKAARMFATAGVTSLQWGLKLDQMRAGIGASQGVANLQILTGNIDVPGGWVCINYGYTQSDIREAIAKDMYEYCRKDRLGDEINPIRTMGYAPHASPDKILEAIETDEPYPIKMVYLCSSNPIANMGAETERLWKAFKRVEFTVVCDLFMTPTAVACADIFLPVSMGCEREGLRGWYTPLRAINKVVETNTHGDEELTLDLGKRLNPEKFPWDSVEEMNEYFMNNLTTMPLPEMTFKELQSKTFIYPKFEYYKYEKGLLREDGQPGFNTATGRIELYCGMYDYCGLDPLPYYEEPFESPIRNADLVEEYPFILTTGRRSWEFFHSEHRQLKSMREFHPDPLVEIHPDDAAALGISDGEWVYIENTHGRCKQKAKVTNSQMKGVVMCEHGWWFPELDGAEPELFGVFESNANMLTTMGNYGPSGYGAPYNAGICKVYKVQDER